jgi:hypothetical protein
VVFDVDDALEAHVVRGMWVKEDFLRAQLCSLLVRVYLEGAEESGVCPPFLELLCCVLDASLVDLRGRVCQRVHEHVLC